jgi:hypothetical protein
VHLGIYVRGSNEDHGEQVCDGCGVRIVDFIGGLDSVLECEQPYFVCLLLLLSTNFTSSLSHGSSPNVTVVMPCTCSPSSSLSRKLLGANCASLDALVCVVRYELCCVLSGVEPNTLGTKRTRMMRTEGRQAHTTPTAISMLDHLTMLRWSQVGLLVCVTMARNLRRIIAISVALDSGQY